MYPGTLPARGLEGNARVRVFLVDDSWAFLGAAEHFLSSEPDVEVVGCTSSGDEAVQQVSLLKPDIVFVDITSPGLVGRNVGRELKELPGGPRIVHLSRRPESGARTAAESASVDGIVMKSEFGNGVMPFIRGILDDASM